MLLNPLCDGHLCLTASSPMSTSATARSSTFPLEFLLPMLAGCSESGAREVACCNKSTSLTDVAMKWHPGARINQGVALLRFARRRREMGKGVLCFATNLTQTATERLAKLLITARTVAKHQCFYVQNGFEFDSD